jgi:hypothetical protein
VIVSICTVPLAQPHRVPLMTVRFPRQEQLLQLANCGHHTLAPQNCNVFSAQIHNHVDRTH